MCFFVRPVLSLSWMGMRPAVHGEFAPFGHARPELGAATRRNGEQRAAEGWIRIVKKVQEVESVVVLTEVIENPRSSWHHLLESPLVMHANVTRPTEDNKVARIVVERLS